MQPNLIIGLGAGLVSAMLFASASTGTVLGLFVLFFLSPMPVAVAGLGWGWKSALAAAFAAALAIGLLVNARGATFHAIAIGLPTAVLSYLALLNRDVQTETGATATEWYPLGRIVAIAAFIAGSVATIGLLTTAADIDGLRDLIRGTLDRMLSRPADAPAPIGAPPPVTPDQLGGLTNVLISLFTASLATMWFAVATVNMWLAGHVVRKSDRLMRPWPDLSQLRLPPTLPIALAVALGASFLPDFAGLVGAGFATALLTAYVLVGLAILHNVTRGHPLRSFLLSGVYAALMLFAVLAVPVLAMIGLAEPFSPLRRKPPPAGPPSTHVQ